MSGKNNDPSSRFISESAIEEARKERETAWKRAYETADGKDAPPDQEYDPRTLYEQLQEQKRRKTEAYAESRRFANQIRKLDTEEIEFLETVDEENIKKYENSRRSEISELAKFKEEIEAARERNATKLMVKHNKSAISSLSRKPLSLHGYVGVKEQKNAAKEENGRVEKCANGGVKENQERKDGNNSDSMQSENPLSLLTSYGSSDSGDSDDKEEDGGS
ncbi:hypothetical protein GGI25_001274 [Coemansia spiralis]|uniref:FAM192A/Fyv6 N-terminal domain-containing protein n=2 Tax=Coemansia TaxID=4863 RepID=A0A9W8KYP2_9FUNG|nr:hypothetical protein EDC05_001348 [Coemansia umbellata]KAJ2624590.1 hypothetical protein GGI26_001283 [Coemansia sp. RSA 1358]KAJ2679822.1 hypothetical protein GGI25_001274 [Coemansia spiralis]